MKTIHLVAAIVILAGAGVAAAIGANSPNRPPGVSAEEWAPINDSVGVVLVQGMIAVGSQRAQPLPLPAVSNNTGAALISPVSGYLMVKRGRIWQRLVVIDPVKGPGEAG
jgi:hypothetical protein